MTHRLLLALFLGLLTALLFGISSLEMLWIYPSTYWLLFCSGGFAIGTLGSWWLFKL